MKSMINLLTNLLIAYVLLIVLMYAMQRILLFHPDKQTEAPQAYGLTDFDETFITTADGFKLQIWYRAANAGFPTIAYFHGNAHNISGRAGIYAALASKGFGVAALSYRGYGKSEGSPSEQGLYADAHAVMSFLKEKNITPDRAALYGESLGTGVAVQMATEYPVSMLILQAPYISVEDRASELYSFVPVKLMIKDKFRSIDKIKNVKAPLVIFHGERDNVIPVKHGRTIFEAASEPKQAFFLPNTNHNDFDSGLISAHVLDFAKKHNLIR
jgi:fermentation-respiration switch protein FrsA (DUF1100 family)